MSSRHAVKLIDPEEQLRDVLIERLLMQEWLSRTTTPLKFALPGSDVTEAAWRLRLAWKQ